MTCQIILSSNAAAKAAADEPPLSDEAKAALFAALDDEYHAEATYAAILEKHGDIRPFSNIIKAERRHAAAIGTLMKAYGIAVPRNAYREGHKPIGEIPPTRAEACAQGIKAEVANVRLYDHTLLPAVAAHPAITEVFTRLRDASRDRHLPAFQRCATGSSGVPDLRTDHHHHSQGCGKGRGRGGCKGH